MKTIFALVFSLLLCGAVAQQPRALGPVTVTTINGVSITTGSGTLTLGSATLNVGTGGTLGTAAFTAASAYQPADADLTTWAGLTPSANAQSLVTAANYGAMRTLLSLVPGADIQAFNANLSTYAGIAPSANVQTLLGAANFAAFKTSLSLGNVENTALSTWAGSGNLTTFSGGTFGTAAASNANAFEVPLSFTTGLTRTVNTVTVNTTQNISKLSGLVTNGFVKTSGGDGTLGVDTSTYLTTAGNGSALTGITQSQVSGLTTSDTPLFANVRVGHSTLTYAGTTTIDFTGDGFQTETLTGDVTFASSNLASGRSKTVRIIGDSSMRNLAFPGGWKFLGVAAPATLAANKVAVLTVTSFGSTDADVIAAFSPEP